MTVGSASALVSSVADLVGYFREDTELTKYSITLSESALLAKVVAEIKEKDKDRAIFMPTRSIDVGGDLFQKLAHVAEQRLELLKINKVIQSKGAEPGYAKCAERAKSEIESVTGAVASLLEQLTTPGEQGAVAPLQTLSYVDKLKAYSDSDAVFLSVAIAGQGGEVQITRSIWTGGRISYIGGATCTYYATDASGKLIAAGTFSSYQKAAYGQRRGVSGLKFKVDRSAGAARSSDCSSSPTGISTTCANPEPTAACGRSSHESAPPRSPSACEDGPNPKDAPGS